MINGVINIFKEKGYTSADVVARLRGILHQKKIGHTGTLDPAAEGVLPVCLGNATGLVESLTDHDKEYVCTCRLGVTTDTEDMTGTVLSRSDVRLAEEEVRLAAESFLGAYLQVPPMYSALKQNGRRLYELAREGIEVERKPRALRITELEILGTELPLFRFRVVCSRGTYIRSLCRDIGEKLGCGAAMEELLRSRSGEFALDGALRLEEVEKLAAEGAMEEHVLPVEHFYRECKCLTVKAEEMRLLENGNPLPAAAFSEEIEAKDGERFRVCDAEGRFRALYVYEAGKERFKAERMYLT
ncbi:MAG: tRNA pseudouridine(55) synthase TruB [Lachnospiraceae bacterium]|nr:tRNA pseudouridine(55) synthase TruB [Lachnospiraceae bacterium]